MARRHWKVVALIVVLLFPLLVSTPFNQIPVTTTAQSSAPNSSPPPPPYGSGIPVGQFEGTGSPTAVFAYYNKTLTQKTETNDTNDFTIDMPPNWTSFINVTFTDITATGLVLDIETNETASGSRDNLPCAMSFQVTNSCKLYRIMIKLYADPGDLWGGNDLWVEIYNATNDGGRPKPDDFPISSSIFLDLGGPGSLYDGWESIIWGSGVYLNTSDTYNNYFFAVATQWPGTFPKWQWRSDIQTGDNGYAWRGSPWTEHTGIDYFLNVTVAPLTFTPAPSQVSMQVNSSSVQDGVSNSGWWETTFVPPSKTVFFDVTTTWPVTFNYTYKAEFSRTFTGITNFLTEHSMALTEWNITTSISFPNVNADANSRTMNFSLPAYWEVQNLYNGTTPIVPTDFKDNSTNPGTPGYVFLNELGGAGNGTLWRIASSDLNYVQTPSIWRGGIDVTGNEVNITDTLSVTAQVTTFLNGNGRFSPYDELDTSLFEETQPPNGGGLLAFIPFTPSSHGISNVTMRCEVVWNNSYHAGVGLSSVKLVYPTTVTDALGPYTGLIGNNVDIRVYYEDTHNSMGVTTGVVNVTFDGTTHSLPHDSGGYYEGPVDTSLMLRGINGGVVRADAPGYAPATTTVSLTLWSKTQLVANWTTYTINYTESVTLEVNYSVLTPLGEGGITNALVNISRSGFFSWLAEEGGGNYTVVLEGTTLGVGTHNLIVNASKPGLFYQDMALWITLTVDGEPTTITGSAPLDVDGGEVFNVTVTYRKQSDGTGIVGANISCLLDDSGFYGFDTYDLGNGTYKLQFMLNVSINPATFNITITASMGGYYNSTFEALVDVGIRPSNIVVQVQSASPLICYNDFIIRVTYQDSMAQVLLGANIQGNWTLLGFIDNGDGTYTIRCQTTGTSVGWWSISFNISVQNYDVQYFTESFQLVWSTSLIPQDGDYTPSEYENETFVFDVTFTNENTGLGVDTATVWVIFQSSTYYLVSVGNGVYRLTLNLTDVSPANYPLDIIAQRTNHQNQTVNVNLEVLAKFDPSLTVELPASVIYEGATTHVTITLAFANGTPIEGAEVGVLVWIHHVNGTDLVLFSELVMTDLFGTRIIPVQLPTYPTEFWTDVNNAPDLWVRAIYDGAREIAASTVSTSEGISPPNPYPWVVLLLQLLPFIILFVIIIIIGWVLYTKRVRPKERAKQQALEQSGGMWAQRMMDLMNLRALFVMYSKTGLPIFTYDFAGGELPSTLLSGFIAAVNAFYSELSGELDRESQLRDIHYKDLHLSLREAKHMISVLILDSSPSEGLTESLAGFTQSFETQFSSELDTFVGRIDVFDPASKLVEESFHGELLLAYECAKTPSRGFPRKIYDLALKLAGESGRIFLPQLFVAAVEKYGPKRKFDIANALEKLHDDGCLVATNDTLLSNMTPSDEPAEFPT